MSDIANATEVLERRISVDPDDAVSRYRLAILLLDEHGRTYEPELLRRAREHLTLAIEVRPKHARSHAALGYTYDLTEESVDQALACFREARRLNSQDKVCDVYFLTLLQESGRESEALVEIESAAARYDVDLDALRHELTSAGMPTDAQSLVMNGFIHARNFFRSSLGDEANSIVNTLEPGRARTQTAVERKRCAEDQQQLAQTFDPARVPESLRSLATWASRFGVGDDYCRPFLLRRLTKQQRAVLIHDIDRSAHAIHAWLDSFGDSTMPPEAAAFMYLTLGIEEIREP